MNNDRSLFRLAMIRFFRYMYTSCSKVFKTAEASARWKEDIATACMFLLAFNRSVSPLNKIHMSRVLIQIFGEDCVRLFHFEPETSKMRPYPKKNPSMIDKNDSGYIFYAKYAGVAFDVIHDITCIVFHLATE